MCKRQSIDESHGLKHAKGTMMRAEKLLLELSNVTENERTVSLLAAALHDCCDRKYCVVSEAAEEIKGWLLERRVSEEMAKAVIDIITTMSYSKLKAASEGSKLVFPDHGRWQRAYHVARHADLLEAYIVARCFLYNKELHPTKTDDEHWLTVRTLFDVRVFNYVKEGWITMPGALAMVPALEAEALRCFEQRSLAWPDILI